MAIPFAGDEVVKERRKGRIFEAMRSIAKSIISYLLLFAFLVGLTPAFFAQSADTGAIFGTIQDKSGAALPGAKVRITNVNTSVSKTLTTNSSGFYSVEAIPSGDYGVVVEKDGFEALKVQNIHLDPGQRREVSPQLGVGSVNESVTVESDALQVKTETSEDSSTIGSKEISTLLVNGRNFQSLATLNPGVNNTNGNNQYSGGGLNSTTTLSIGGTGVDDTTYSIDGVYNMNTGNYINLNISPSMDAIAEFTVLKANYSARYGTASNSTILVDTKSGTSTYHGTAWDYLRNDAMDASAYYSQGQKTALHQNIFGFSFGGPLQIPKVYNWDRKKKTFFFASDEWWSNSVGSTATTYVITKAMRTGNLAGSIGFPSGGLTLTPQGQSLLAAQGKTNCIASPTTLNPNCFDSTAMAILNHYQPTENAVNPSFNYINTDHTTFSQIDHDYRIDHEFSPKEALTARVMYEQTNSFYPFSAYEGSSVAGAITDSVFTSGLNAVVRLTSTFGSSIVNTASAAETFDKPRLHASPAPIPSGAQIGYFYPNANPSNTVPNIGIGGYDSIGVGPLPINASDGEGIINDDISILRGKHSLQAGAFYIFGIKNQNSGDATQGSFSFNGTYTGSGAADYLLGLHDGYSQPSSDPHFTAHYRSTEFYVQDDWKATSRLSINAGVRFFYYSPDWLSGPTSETSNFEFSQYNPAVAPVVLPGGNFQTNSAGVPITAAGTVANLENGLVFNTTPGVPRGFYHDSSVHPAPRIGFAYALSNDKRSSIHAGYGVGYTRVPFQITSAFGQNPPGVTSGNSIAGTLEDPTVDVQANVPAPLALQLVNTNFKPSQVQNFSLILEQEVFRDAIFQIGYSGSQSRHLRAGSDQNQVLPTSTPALSNCLATGQSPSAVYDFDPCLNTNAISSDYIRPYKGYDQLFDWLYSVNGNYNSLQSQLRVKRKSVDTTLNYTWGKALGDANGGANFRSSYSSDQNSYCLRCEYGPRNFNRSQIFTANVIYALPFFRGGGLKEKLLGGWSLSGIAIAQSGFPQTPGLSAPNTGLASRPDQVGAPHFSSNRKQMFDPNAYAIPAYGFFGTASVGSIPGPKDVAFNTAIYKTFAFNDRVNFQFRAEAFNVANHPSFSGVNTGIGPNDPNPGLVNGPSDPRILEMVGRITF
jgi:Carboxypeptidase regulatory-like domain/TonB-dependent Receptor Plug Domain